MYARADSIEGQFQDQGYHFGDTGGEEGEDEFELLAVADAVHQRGTRSHQVLVDVDVEDGGHEGVRQGEADAAVEAASFTP